jgi:endonuclease/exonuclease/phosphatase family metal-dependent hydrolase
LSFRKRPRRQRKNGEYSGFFYQRDHFEPGDAGTFWLSDTPEKPGSMTWGNEIPRVAWLHLLDRATGRGFYVFNTHWDHKGTVRERAAILMARKIDGRKQRDERWFCWVISIRSKPIPESSLPGWRPVLAFRRNLENLAKRDGIPFKPLHRSSATGARCISGRAAWRAILKVDHIFAKMRRSGKRSIPSGDKPMVSVISRSWRG